MLMLVHRQHAEHCSCPTCQVVTVSSLVCVQFSFHGQVFAAMEELQSTYSTLLDTQDRLATVEQENAGLKQQCDEFVKKNLDHMLAWRSLKSKADALEGVNHAGPLRLAKLLHPIQDHECWTRWSPGS